MYITDMALLAEKKNSELVSEPSMHFWGITCSQGKKYAQVVGERFRVTMAVLDPKSAPKTGDKTVSVLVERSNCAYLLCVLKHGEIHQVNLNLIFDKGENVMFFVEGHGNVCLSGYQLTNSERDVLDDEIGFLCPLVEVKASKSKSEDDKVPKSPIDDPNSVSPKSKKKAKKEKDLITSEDRKTLNSWNIKSINKRNGDVKVLEFDEESDESDEDFSIGEESSESLESEEFDEEELEEELEEEISMLQEDEEAEEDDEEQEEPKSKSDENAGSRKRKHEKKSQLQEISFNDKDSSDSDIVTLSEEDTPIPKKTKSVENNSEKKKKKKKKLNQSALSEKSVTENSPKTTKSTETTPQKYPVVKLQGGVEVQDVIVGKGPVATKGKMAHVFYIGRFQNNEVFDSRLPGKKPFSFKVGTGGVIKGWDIGLQGMKVGGKRKLKIPPHMGYGNAGMEGLVPPNSTLFFIVELQAVS